ncbi:MAG: transporter substrate-binding domain-containing protein [Lachnospiraceae bacterium]|nr:transporter substrate-binding domain-containing protein [Lachnospiraceae bacterium]
MKKVLAVLLAGSMAAALAACGSTKSTDSAAQSSAANTIATEAAGASEAAAQTDLSGSKYLSDGVMTVALNSTFPPFEYLGDGSDDFSAITSNPTQATGFDVALVNEIGTRLGVKVEIEDMDFDGIIAAIGTKADVAATGMTINDERKKSVNFSDPYYDATQAVLLTKDSSIATEDDLKKASSIGVQQGTTGENIARGINDAATVSVKSFNQAVADLMNGKNDAVIVDQSTGEAFLSQNPDKLKLLPGSQFKFDTEQYGIAMPKDDEVMLGAINGALEAMKADGTYDSLVEKYINNYEAQ